MKCLPHLIYILSGPVELPLPLMDAKYTVWTRLHPSNLRAILLKAMKSYVPQN